MWNTTYKLPAKLVVKRQLNFKIPVDFLNSRAKLAIINNWLEKLKSDDEVQ